jgi:hypothetical protein
MCPRCASGASRWRVGAAPAAPVFPARLVLLHSSNRRRNHHAAGAEKWQGVGILACSRSKTTTKSQSGEFTLAVANDGKVTLAKGGSVKWSLGPFGSDGAPYALSLRPSGDLVVLSSGYSNIVWSSASGCSGSAAYSAQVGSAADTSAISSGAALQSSPARPACRSPMTARWW